jgi:hypothetical protein
MLDFLLILMRKHLSLKSYELLDFRVNSATLATNMCPVSHQQKHMFESDNIVKRRKTVFINPYIFY